MWSNVLYLVWSIQELSTVILLGMCFVEIWWLMKGMSCQNSNYTHLIRPFWIPPSVEALYKAYKVSLHPTSMKISWAQCWCSFKGPVQYPTTTSKPTYRSNCCSYSLYAHLSKLSAHLPKQIKNKIKKPPHQITPFLLQKDPTSVHHSPTTWTSPPLSNSLLCTLPAPTISSPLGPLSTLGAARSIVFSPAI